MSIPVIALIDVEPDPRMIPHDEKLPWAGYEELFHYYGKLREDLKTLTGNPVHFGWYYRVDPQVAEVYGDPAWALNHYRGFLNHFQEQGDEIGLHPHAYRWNSEHNCWIVDHANQEWVNHCVQMSFDSFYQSMGRRCESFRFGERWMNTATMNLVESLGARFDLTLEPFQKLEISYVPAEAPFHTGFLPDGRFFLRKPYRPSPRNFAEADKKRKDGIWVVPLSSGEYAFEVGRWEKIKKFFTNPGYLKPRPYNLNPMIHPKVFRKIFNDCLKAVKPSYLTLTVRSDAGCKLGMDSHFRLNWEFVKSHPQVHQFQFTTVQEAMALLGYEDTPSVKNRATEKIFS